MTEHYNSDDTFLARWMAGTLSEAERTAFEKTDAYKQFRLINEESQKLEGPEIDVEAALKQVKLKIETLPKPKRSKVIRIWYSVAAAAILLISLAVILNSDQTYVTGIGEKQNITLQDGSVINLNANSSISLKRFFWMHDKMVTLKGEGYFTIKEGTGFIVNTSKGAVNVLGTEFNIRDRSDFEIKCYGGTVQFSDLNTSQMYTLTKGMQLHMENGVIKEDTFNEDAPSWKTGISTFIDKPISVILDELSYIYPITFDRSTINTNRLFTGSFVHDDLKNALHTTLVPMGIGYQMTANNHVIVLSE
ncbi:FecR domain-containing protein [Seonamhaeicola sp.]|uniref:FecR family protein n=1 Tax=Seonamhaeicola sp. TaxID=1912245 RepID=UPI002613A9F8|nr:FecR domain-containing protein [Seonamhaeicola sp.]